MSKQTEAMKLALEALEQCYSALAEELSAWDTSPPAQTDWEAVAADRAMTIALLKSELQEFAEKQADAVEVALTESGWVWDGDQWQRPAQRTWVGLTDEERTSFVKGGTQFRIVKAIEAKLKEKNSD